MTSKIWCRLSLASALTLSALLWLASGQAQAVEKSSEKSTENPKQNSTENSNPDPKENWRDLSVKRYLDDSHKVRFYEWETDNHSRASLIVMPLDNIKSELRPALNNPTSTTSQTVRQAGAIAGVNGGYFNLRGGLSASYITIDGKLVANPQNNDLLTGNPKLKPYLQAIFNRSELRILLGRKGKTTARIQRHNEPIPAGYTLKHALQAGPRLLPNITAKEEAFVRTDFDGTVTDSIGSLRTAARTAFGITPDGHGLILCISGPKQDEFSSGMTLAAVADLLAKLGCSEAINLDGGTSTTMVVKSDGKDDYTKVCGQQPETLVKSCLLIKETP